MAPTFPTPNTDLPGATRPGLPGSAGPALQYPPPAYLLEARGFQVPMIPATICFQQQGDLGLWHARIRSPSRAWRAVPSSLRSLLSTIKALPHSRAPGPGRPSTAPTSLSSSNPAACQVPNRPSKTPPMNASYASRSRESCDRRSSPDEPGPATFASTLARNPSSAASACATSAAATTLTTHPHPHRGEALRL